MEARDGTAPRVERPPRGEFFGLTLMISATAYLGFSLTYFGPVLTGAYPDVSPAVHVHGWSFFLWYALLPAQAGLVRARKLAAHRVLGYASVLLATLMVFTGVLVLGTQMDRALGPGGNGFWLFLGPAVFASLLLFAGFYGAAIWARNRPAEHKRHIVLASAGGLGAATFRILGSAFGFATWAQVAGVLAPNLFLIAAILIDRRRCRTLHPVLRMGLPVSVLATVVALLIVPTAAGRWVSEFLALFGRVLAPLY